MSEAIKVFLVEDEMIIRNGIKKSINWEKEGYIFAGEASDGELAYTAIMKAKPDILITDIKMPFMDGLELSSLIKKELPDIKIIILSGYDEFEYAKAAIRIGVTEYLLKPISAAKLLETLGEVAQIIRQEREEKELLVRYSEDTREKQEHDKMKLFSWLVMGDISMAEAVEAGKKYEMELSASCYRILLFKILTTSENRRQTEEMIQACEEIEGIALQTEGAYAFQRGVDGWAFLLTGEDETQMEEKSRQFSKQLRSCMEKFEGFEYFGGMGNSVVRIRNLNQAFREAEKAFAARFTKEANQILSIEEVNEIQENRSIETKGFVEIGKSREILEKFLNNGTLEEVEVFSEEYIDQLQSDSLKSTLVRQYVVMDIYMVIMSFCEKFSITDMKLKKEVGELQSAIQSLHSLKEMKKYLSYLLSEAIELRDAVSGRRYSDLIATAKDMIDKNYMADDISLNTVAANVGMSPSYFSSIFSKESGKTFVEYLTEVRVEKAKELLMCSSMKTSEIGFEVGYKDPHYFSYIFKKTQGCSPKEYRARRKE